MTVHELIDQLKALPQTLVVLRDDNSGGIEAIHGLRLEDATEIKTGKDTQAVVLGDKE